MKILSIIVPAYNMEGYLERCLNSVLNHKWDKELEVIVVNDGSKDRTLQIALAYKEKFSEIVTVIDKENGNQGSAMNAGLRVAKGKYVKELDADDWFDTKEFERFIEQLKNVDCDLVITNSTENYSSGKKEKRVYSSNKDNRIYDFSIMSSLKFCRLDMQATSYRTELLREINYQQTEGIFYTDQEWCFYPMFFVNSIAFINANVYQYFIGRPGQTVDRAVWFKHNHHRLIIVKRLLSYYTSFIIDNALPEEKRKYVLFIMNHIIISLYRCYLFLLPKENFNVKDLQKFDNDIKEIQDLIQFNIYSVRIHKLIPFPLLWYWRKFSKRMPQGIIRFLFILKKLKRRL